MISIAKEITALRRSLRSVDRYLCRLVPLLTAAARNGQAKASPTHSRRRLSRKARAALVLQGRYMGYMRQLKPKQKAQVRKVKEVKGVGAAIAAARRLVN